MGSVLVIPADAGIQMREAQIKDWTPAFAGVTRP